MLFCSVLPQDFKNAIYLYVYQKVPKIAFQKVTSSPLPIFTITPPKCTYCFETLFVGDIGITITYILVFG